MDRYGAHWGAARTAQARAYLETPAGFVAHQKREAVRAVCESKQAFSHPDTARQVRDKCAQKRPSHAETEPYRCDYCRKWHLGHRPIALIAERAGEGAS